MSVAAIRAAAAAPTSGRPLSDGPELPARLRKPRLRRSEAVEYLALAHGITVAVSTLAKWASIGRGPPFARLHASPLYERAAIDAWVAATLKPAMLGGDTQRTRESAV